MAASLSARWSRAPTDGGDVCWMSSTGRAGGNRTTGPRLHDERHQQTSMYQIGPQSSTRVGTLFVGMVMRVM